VKVLRSVLYAQAAVWGACGLAIVTFPRSLIHGLFHQPPYPDYAYVRVAGVLSLGLALLVVLVAQRLEDVWWWSWAFLITAAGVMTVTALQLLFGNGTGSSNWLWAIFAAVNAVFTIALLVGIGRAAQEKPFA
jgi:hypothetical protein